MRSPLRSATLVLASALFAGCSDSPSPPTWRPVDIDALATEQRIQLDQAVFARDALFAELSQTLMTQVAQSGPASAIAVCREEAPRIAAEVSERSGLRIGRTSFKLRNPDNAAPAWAEPLLAERPEEPRVVLGPAGQLGVTLPIHLQAKCLACHGSAESIPADVREALAALYPADQARGFSEGDLRGWFWVEVPGEAR